MNGKLAIGGAIALPAALVVVGGYALGYAHGYQDALGVTWNLRGVAQCIDSSVPPGGDPSDDRAEPYPPSRWVWKSGPTAGEPVERWTHTFFANPFRRTPLLGTIGDRLERYATVDVANWHPPGYR
jgi:hypothetical protein